MKNLIHIQNIFQKLALLFIGITITTHADGTQGNEHIGSLSKLQIIEKIKLEKLALQRLSPFLLTASQPNLTIQEYAKQCEIEIGAPMPPFDCSNGAEVIIRKNGQPITTDVEKCDNPALLGGHKDSCARGTRIGHLTTQNPDVDITYICRKYQHSYTNNYYNDIAVIHHNKKTGATCWYQSQIIHGSPKLKGKVPSPNQVATTSQATNNSIGDVKWYDPDLLPRCHSCHQADPYIHTPFLHNVKDANQRNVVPENPNGNYWHFKLQKWNVEMKYINVLSNTPAKACTGCHRIGSTNNTCKFIGDSTGHPSGNQFSHALHPNQEWMHTSSANSFELLPLSQDTNKSYQELLQCCHGSIPNVCELLPIPGQGNEEKLLAFSQKQKKTPGGAEKDDRFGWSINASGDFNHDGYDDLVIGIPNEDIRTVHDAGGITVIYGSENGLTHDNIQWFDQDTPKIPGGVEAGDKFGSSLSSGDFNHDGYDDLVIGIPNEDLSTTKNAGAITVIYGSASGLDASTSKWFDQDTPKIPGGVEAGDKFGSSLSSGDFNHDGYDDLVIGIPNEDIKNTIDAGGITILYGSKNGLTASGSQWFDQDSPNMPGGTEKGDLFGWALSTGDFNHDGYVDLTIGIPFEDIKNTIDAGGITILYGSKNGLTASGSQWFDQDSPNMPGGTEKGDLFGWALSTGDFNHDGYDDLVAGIPSEDIGTIKDAGGITIIYGSVNGLTSNKVQWFDQDSPDMPGGVEANDFFSRALASGDFNYDGYMDLAIGIPYEDLNSLQGAGAITILYGSQNGLTASNSKWFDQNTPGIPGVIEKGDLFGWALSSGDFNNDKYYDLAIGIPWEAIENISAAGMVSILYGK